MAGTQPEHQWDYKAVKIPAISGAAFIYCFENCGFSISGRAEPFFSTG